MKVLFIYLNHNSVLGVSHGISALSGVLRKAGHDTKLLHIADKLSYSCDVGRIKKDIEEYKPDIVAFSLLTTQFWHIKGVIEEIAQSTKAHVICGGPHVSQDPQSVIDLVGVDSVCIGEGEGAIVDLANVLHRGGRTNEIMMIQNLWVKTLGGIVKNRVRPFVNLEELPKEDFSIFDMKKLCELKNGEITIIAGRGCPYQCTYCVNLSLHNRYKKDLGRKSGNYIRFKTIDQVIGEIKDMIAQIGNVTRLAFVDDSFTLNKKRLRQLLKDYKKEIDLPFNCNTNPMVFDEEVAKILKDGGCINVRFGVECGSERIRKEVLHRPMNNERIKQAFEICRKSGIMSGAYIMVGLPTETETEWLETVRFCAEIQPDMIRVSTFYPFADTEIYNFCEDNDLIDKKVRAELESLDGMSCLKMSDEERLKLDKIHLLFSWYLNRELGNEAFEEWLRGAQKLNAQEWKEFDFKGVEKGLSENEKGIHYEHRFNDSISVRFPNTFMEEYFGGK